MTMGGPAGIGGRSASPLAAGDSLTPAQSLSLLALFRPVLDVFCKLPGPLRPQTAGHKAEEGRLCRRDLGHVTGHKLSLRRLNQVLLPLDLDLRDRAEHRLAVFALDQVA